MQNTMPTCERERRMAEEIWLNYLNRYLLEHGVISEKEFSRMTELILKQKSKSPPHKEA